MEEIDIVRATIRQLEIARWKTYALSEENNALAAFVDAFIFAAIECLTRREMEIKTFDIGEFVV